MESHNKYVRDRLSIFVDGNNMFYAQQKNGWFFDDLTLKPNYPRKAQAPTTN